VYVCLHATKALLGKKLTLWICLKVAGIDIVDPMKARWQLSSEVVMVKAGRCNCGNEQSSQVNDDCCDWIGLDRDAAAEVASDCVGRRKMEEGKTVLVEK